MESFLSANPGMARRVAYKFNFEDYNPQQLTTIAVDKASKRGLRFSPLAVASLPDVFDKCFTVAARSMWNGGLAARVQPPSPHAMAMQKLELNDNAETRIYILECRTAALDG